MSDAGEVCLGLSRVHDVATSNFAGPPPSPIVPRLALGGVLFHSDGTETQLERVAHDESLQREREDEWLH